MRNEIVVAVVDTGIEYDKMNAAYRARLYRNEDEIAGNGRDDDGNGLVDDVTGPSTGSASNGYYQDREGSGHGQGMVGNVIKQLDAAEAALGEPLPASVMPVSMYTGGYYANILAAAKAGASVISLSHNVSYGQKAYISQMLEPYDVIAVTVGRDTADDHKPDIGEGEGRAFDNVIEVGLISDAITRGNVHVDLLEVGSNLGNRSESHAIAKAAGKIAGVWAVDPSMSPAEVLDVVEAATTREHATIQSKGLRSEMGGQLDLERAVALAHGPAGPDDGIDLVKEEGDERDLNEIAARGGYARGTAGDDLVSMGDDRAIVDGGGGDDVFLLTEMPGCDHILRDFDDGDLIDLGALAADADELRFERASWGGGTHSRVLVEDDGAWHRVVVVHDAPDLGMDDILL